MSQVVNKKALTELLADNQNITKKNAAEIVDFVFDTIKSELSQGNTVDLSGFGKFEVKTRGERTGVNPKTKERIVVKASKSPAFKASKTLKDAVK